ncbi:LPXTG-motif cell wall anchor domain protein [Desulfitobacterium hafniense DCB-2]|uniref:LPXTG-motif cell wall anchor domain protein n=1 Tax=Desulfitobacterium hafniense (strain DSM 10664 / DCB-2) TaxID=272564 RepID=B8FUN8_DESHD|nr:Cna B-type domain-containing protein [Desulfitobacterium hafniense]ACL22308.1 LPXTG-motif cell wall anchor domain protein [Desulfitobacterium hafniense DCB-2]
MFFRKSKSKVRIAVLVILAMLMQAVGPIAPAFAATGGESFRIMDENIAEGTAYLDWELTLDPDDPVTVYSYTGGFTLNEAVASELRAADGTVLGSYHISTAGALTVTIDQELYAGLEQKEVDPDPAESEGPVMVEESGPEMAEGGTAPESAPNPEAPAESPEGEAPGAPATPAEPAASVEVTTEREESAEAAAAPAEPETVEPAAPEEIQVPVEYAIQTFTGTIIVPGAVKNPGLVGKIRGLMGVRGSGMEINKSVLTNLKETITQDGKSIAESGTIMSTRPIKVEISFGVPVEGDDPTPVNPVKKGDWIIFELGDAFELISGSSIELKAESGTLVGYVSFEADSVTKMVTAKVDFDGEEEVFNGDVHSVTCKFHAEFQYDASSSSGGAGDHTVTILGKPYTVNVPAVPIEYNVTKTGTADLADQSITWTANISATQGGTDVDLAGYQFFDDLTSVGDYMEGTFKVGSEGKAPTLEDKKLSYIFPTEGSASPRIIEFKTKIPDGKYQANSKQTVVNKAELRDKDEKMMGSGQSSVEFTPKWIEKKGVSSDAGSSGTYDPKDRTITWTITANHMGADLKGVVITDKLQGDLELQSAKWQTWNGSEWVGEKIITPDGAGEYSIGDINSEILLTIVTEVPNDDYTTGEKTYTNSASIRWTGVTGSGPGSGNVGVTIGYNAMSKYGVVDAANQKIRWTVTVDTKKQEIPDMKVYDLLVYGKSIDLSNVSGIPEGIAHANLTPRFGQKYADNFSGSPFTMNVIPITQGDVQVADLLEITGLSTTSVNTFSFNSQVVDPDIFAGNKTPTVQNTATLFSGTTKVNAATGSVNYKNNMLLKGMLKRAAISNPATGVNAHNTTTATESFDYQDKSAIFRLSVNADGIDLTNTTNAAGEPLGKATLTDTLPEGWEFVDIVEGSKYLIFEGIKKSDKLVDAEDITPDTVTGLNASFNGRTATFEFTSLAQPYVILVKSKPTSATVAEYFSKNDTETITNSVALKTERWTSGVTSTQNITITSEILGKAWELIKAGEVRWTVDYKPYDLEQPGERLEDKLPLGIDLRMDSSGKLVLEGNITANEMTLQADGRYTLGDPVELRLGTNVSYDNGNRVLSFIIPNKAKAYRFSYITDVTGEPGSVTNKVSLLGENSVGQENTGKSYSITAQDGSASLLRNGSISITKTKEGSVPFPGVEFTLYAKDGTTVIKKGVTGSDGTLKLKVIPDGEYILRETKVPDSSGYTLENVDHSLMFTTSGGGIVSSIDGKTGTQTAVITIQNFQTGTVGNLKINKVVAGNDADTTKAFNFTLTLDGAAGTYAYIGHGVPGGTIKTGDDFSLAHGQSITIVGLPKEAAYTVTEADYSGDGYSTISTNETGNIVADTTQTASFTNSRLEITGTKVWQGGPAVKPEIQLQLYRNNLPLGSPVTLNGSETPSWIHTWTHLDKTDSDGNDYRYRIDEVKTPPNYGKSISSDGLTITNTYGSPKTAITGSKIWEGGPSIKPSIQLQLYRNGVKQGEPVELVNGQLSHTWNGLDTTDNTGRAYTYTVDEVEVPPVYAKTVSPDGLTITNTFIGKVEYAIDLKADPSTIVGDGKSETVLTTRVTDDKGNPVAGVEVVFEAPLGTFLGDPRNPQVGKQTGVTDANGEAQILYRSEKIEGIDPQKVPVIATVADPEKGLYATDTIYIIFEPSAITGVVTDNQTGKPIAGAKVVVTKDFDGDGIIDFRGECITGPDGKYRVPIPKGDTVYDVEITKSIIINGEPVDVSFKQKAEAGEVNADQGDEEFPAQETFTGVIITRDKDGRERIAGRGTDEKIVLKQVTAEGVGGKEAEVDSKTGVFTIEELSKGQTYEFVMTMEVEGQELIMGKIVVQLNTDGQISIHEELIDPYGTITDSETGKILGDVYVELFYADTPRNKAEGRTPHTKVILPILPGFAPNDNENPQRSASTTVFNEHPSVKDHGNYAWMVFSEADYYIKGTKTGYNTYTSPTISVDFDVVKHDFVMQPLDSGGDGDGGSSGGGSGGGDITPTPTEDNTKPAVPGQTPATPGTETPEIPEKPIDTQKPVEPQHPAKTPTDPSDRQATGTPEAGGNQGTGETPADGKGTLPKTGENGNSGYYTLGMLFIALGLYLGRRRTA